MVFMSKGISQADVSGFLEEKVILQRFDLLRRCLVAVLDAHATDEEKRQKSEVLLCLLNGAAHNLITISSYPWSNPDDIVRAAITGLVERK